MRYAILAEEEHRPQVDGHHLVPILIRQFEDRLVCHHRGIIDDHVDLAPFVYGGPNGCLHFQRV
jgi:hypothetical protein